MVSFRDRVHTIRLERFRLRRRDRGEDLPAIWAVGLPVLLRQLCLLSKRRGDGAVGRACVRALAVDGHGRGDEELLHAVAVDECLDELRRPAHVRLDVPSDLVHALPDADHRGEVDDDLDIRQGRLEDAGVTQVLECVMGLRVQVSRLRLVDLGFQFVDHVDLVSAGDEFVDQVAADEPRSAGHEYVFRHVCPSIRLRKVSIVRRRPSSRDTFGSHPRSARAFVMSGQRTFGSPGGSG